MNTLGVGLIGSDVHVSDYIKAFTACPDAELIGVADDNEETAQDLCRQGQMKYATTDYQQLLDDADIQIILVCTPDLFHAEHAITALRAGKHVLGEKPMGVDIESCRKLVQTVDDTGLTFMASQFMRFEPIYKRIKGIYDAEGIGHAFSLKAATSTDMRSLYNPVTWRSHPQTAQNILIGAAAIPSIYSGGRSVPTLQRSTPIPNGYATQDFPLDDCYIFTFQFENGCVGKVLVTSGCKGRGWGEGFLSIYGTEGTIWKNRIHHPDGATEEIVAETEMQFRKLFPISLTA